SDGGCVDYAGAIIALGSRSEHMGAKKPCSGCNAFKGFVARVTCYKAGNPYPTPSMAFKDKYFLYKKATDSSHINRGGFFTVKFGVSL
ncbi:hypothetical protein, partial [Shewanella schlegeliana]|uniref:hypothetical protein n=1 Tax=Shewanella schlegeliana TaxID=190308 RepID=UPI001C7DA503